VLAARAFVSERTLLVMADQIVAPGLVRELVAAPAAGDRSVLWRRPRPGGVFDTDDATKPIELGGDRLVGSARVWATDVPGRQRRAVRDGLPPWSKRWRGCPSLR